MTKKRFRAMVLLGVRQLWDPYYQGFAAQIAFFLILSIVPTVTIVTQILGLFHISATFMNQWIGRRGITGKSACVHCVLCWYLS